MITIRQFTLIVTSYYDHDKIVYLDCHELLSRQNFNFFTVCVYEKMTSFVYETKNSNFCIWHVNWSMTLKLFL